MNQIKKYVKKQPYTIIKNRYSDGQKEFVVTFTNPKFKDVIGVGKTRRQAVKIARGNLDDWLDWYNSDHRRNKQ